MNRAAQIGVCLPCLVPREWTGGVLDEDEHSDGDVGREEEERKRLLLSQRKGERPANLRDKVLGSEDVVRARRMSVGEVRDEDGRVLPTSETTPLLGLVRE